MSPAFPMGNQKVTGGSTDNTYLQGEMDVHIPSLGIPWSPKARASYGETRVLDRWCFPWRCWPSVRSGASV